MTICWVIKSMHLVRCNEHPNQWKESFQRQIIQLLQRVCLQILSIALGLVGHPCTGARGGSMRDGLHLLFSVLCNMFVILYYSLWVGNTFVDLPPAVQWETVARLSTNLNGQFSMHWCLLSHNHITGSMQKQCMDIFIRNRPSLPITGKGVR